MQKSFWCLWLFSFILIDAHANDTTVIKTKKIINPAENAGLKLPEGFGASVVADSLGNARHIVATRKEPCMLNWINW